MSCEEGILTIKGDWTNGALDGVVVDLDAAIGEEQAEPVPVFGDVFQGFSGWRFGRETGSVVGQPKLEGLDDGF